MYVINFRTGDFYFGDCLEIMPTLTAGSVDMVLCDLPYGTTQNKWDTVIPFEPLWASYWRLLKANGPAVLTAQCPFDKALGASQIRHLKYEWIWEKTKATGHLNAKKQPMKAHENILAFYKSQCTYNPQNTVTGLNIRNDRKNKAGNGNYGTVSANEYFQTVGNFPRSVIQIGIEIKPIHPTQKPVALFEYLIRTYTNPGELVLDNCAGSGTMAIAAIQSGRRWICIEQDPTYYSAAIARVFDAEAAL